MEHWRGRASHRAEDPELTSDMRPFHQRARIDPLVPVQVCELRVELLPFSFLARKGDRIRLEIPNQDPPITDAPMTHFYGIKVGTDTYHPGPYAPLDAPPARASPHLIGVPR